VSSSQGHHPIDVKRLERRCVHFDESARQTERSPTVGLQLNPDLIGDRTVDVARMPIWSPGLVPGQEYIVRCEAVELQSLERISLVLGSELSVCTLWSEGAFNNHTAAGS
jgi:hypothetical protein